MTDPEFIRQQVTSVYSGDVVYDLPAPRSSLDSIDRCRRYCAENLCGNYGASNTCPPFSDDPRACKSRLESFSKTLLIIKRYFVSLDNREKMEACLLEVQQICRDIHVSLLGSNIRSLPLANGPCRYCVNCSCTEGEACRFPLFRVGSISPYGVMINEYLEGIGIPPEPVGDSITLYGFVLYD